MAVDGRHAQLGRLAQFVGREMLGRVPLQCMGRKAFGGERGRRFGDDALVVVEQGEGHRTTSLSG
jgi:hypothetical protein